MANENTMRTITASTIATIAVLFLVSGCSTTHRSGTSALEGTWNGREPGIMPETPRQLVISGNRIEYRGAVTNDWGKGTFVMRENAYPKQLVIALAECGIPQYVGKTCYMIYRLDGGTLSAAASEPGNPLAPSSFDAPHARRMVFNKAVGETK
jgi:uncharacterized protein (TIGR03067 family)